MVFQDVTQHLQSAVPAVQGQQVEAQQGRGRHQGRQQVNEQEGGQQEMLELTSARGAVAHVCRVPAPIHPATSFPPDTNPPHLISGRGSKVSSDSPASRGNQKYMCSSLSVKRMRPPPRLLPRPAAPAACASPLPPFCWLPGAASSERPRTGDVASCPVGLQHRNSQQGGGLGQQARWILQVKCCQLLRKLPAAACRCLPARPHPCCPHLLR